VRAFPIDVSTIRRVRRRLALVIAASLALAVVSGAGPAGAAAPPCGSVIVAGGSWLGGAGVPVKSNGAQQNTGYNCGSYSTANPAVQYGNAWQCVELAARLYYVKGWGTVRAGGNGGAKYIPEGSPGLTFHANGSGYKPVPGDLVIHSNGTYGHVTVVDRVVGSTVYAVEQNASVTGRRSYTLSGSTLSATNVLVRGVMHSPKNHGQEEVRLQRRRPFGHRLVRGLEQRLDPDAAVHR
jgi:hypothetical protein